MAITITPFQRAKSTLLGGASAGEGPVDWLSDTIKVALVLAAYTPGAAHEFWSDVTNELATGSGYTTGGATLGSKTVTDGATALADAADVTWNFTATKTFRYAVIYKDTGTAATSPLIAYIDFGADQTPNVDYTLVFNASGILSIA